MLAAGDIDVVTTGMRLEDRFIEAVGGIRPDDDLSWLRSVGASDSDATAPAGLTEALRP